MNLYELQVSKLDSQAILPTRATQHSAGYDLVSNETYTLQSGERHAFSTGIAIGIPVGCYGRIAPRSGLAFNHGIDVLAGVIDRDYAKEIKVILLNTGKEPVTLKQGDRIAQLILEEYKQYPVITVPLQLLSSNLLNVAPIATSNACVIRTGGFGSTGT